MTFGHDICAPGRHPRRRLAACDEQPRARLGCTPATVHEPATPRRRCFVEGPLDAAYVLLEERREQLLSLTR